MSQSRSAITAPAMGRREWAMLLVLAVLWGGSFFFALIVKSVATWDAPATR